MPAQPEKASSHVAKERAAASSQGARAPAAANTVPPPKPPDPPERPRFRVLSWRGFLRWLRENTFTPLWLPTRWRHPLMGYLLGSLMVVVAVAGDLLVAQFFPSFQMLGLLVILAVLLTALTWGAGPSLAATLVSVILLDYLDIPPAYTFSKQVAMLLMDDFFFLVVGGIISVIAVQVQRGRRKAEALAASLEVEHAHSELERQRLQTVLDVLPVGVAIAEAQGQMLKLNHAFKELWGEAAPLPADIAGYSVYRGWWPDTGKPIAADEWAMARALIGGEVCLGEEVEIETFDGQRKAAISTAAPIRDEAGMIIGGVEAILDITERKAAEQERAHLLEGEQAARAEADARAGQLEAIFAALSDGLIVFDARGYIARINPAARSMQGSAADELDFFAHSLAEWCDLLALRDEHGQPMTEDQLPVRRALRGEVLASSHAEEIMMRMLDGREVVMSTSTAPVRNAEGHIVGAVAAFRDVTERRQLERRTHEALNGLLEIAQTLVHASDEPSSEEEQRAAANPIARRLAEVTAQILGCQRLSIFSHDPETNLLHPLAVVGFSPELEQRWRDEGFSLHPDETRRAELLARLLEGRSQIWDMTQPPLSDQPNPAGVRAVLTVPLRLRERLLGALFLDYGAAEHSYTPEERSLAEGTALLAALALQRERLLREREEARANELALREANRQMDEFLGVAGHELRTPLTSVLLGLQLSQRRYERLMREDADVTAQLYQKLAFLLQQLALTERQAQRLDRLVNDLLDVARIQAGKLEMHRHPADLAAIVAEAVEEQRQAAPERAIHLHLPPAGQHVPLSIDADRIGQVVTNYLTNALKYSPEEQPVEVGLEIEAEAARVWVRDYGAGLPLEEQPLIWERFHRVPGVEVQSGSGVGLGLGLHISRTIIEAHQGQVGVQSAPGAGASFWFTLPLSSS